MTLQTEAHFLTYIFMLGRIIGVKHCNIDLWTCLHEKFIDTNTIHAKQISIWITYRYGNNHWYKLYETAPQQGNMSSTMLIKIKSLEHFRTTEFLYFGWTLILKASTLPNNLSSASSDAFKSRSPSLNKDNKFVHQTIVMIADSIQIKDNLNIQKSCLIMQGPTVILRQLTSLADCPINSVHSRS